MWYLFRTQYILHINLQVKRVQITSVLNYTTMSLVDQKPVEVHEEETSDAIDKETQLRYRIWKKNTPYLYDYVSTNSLLWPSLTVQFFPDLETVPQENQLAFQRMLLGTFTLGQAVDTISICQLPYYRNLNKCINVEQWNYTPEKEEFELSSISKTKLRVLQSITHLGDVNKLRYMPQNPDVIASSNNLGDLSVYNRTKHSSIKKLTDDVSEPQLRLQNPDNSGTDIFAFDWNRQKEGVLVSGSVGGGLSVYDIKSGMSKDSIDVAPFKTNQTAAGVNDVEWVPTHDSVFASADDLGTIMLFDTRKDGSFLSTNTSDAVNSVCINPSNTFCLASGHSNGTMKVWDLRSFDKSAYSFEPHSDAITQLKWHPKYSSVLGSSSADRLVKLHDLSDFENDSGLLFNHSGHMLGVNDFDWSPHEDWMVASVADDNSLHVWKPAEHLLKRFESS